MLLRSFTGILIKNTVFFLERFEKDHSAVLKTFEESLLVGFTDPTAYLEVITYKYKLYAEFNVIF